MKMEDSTFKDKAARLGLTINQDIYMRHDEKIKGRWHAVLTRSGYRKVACTQPTYVRHMVYPIYDNTVITIDGNNVRVEISGKMSNLMGAIGFLWRNDVDGPFVWQITLDDYAHMKGIYWDSMRCTMLVKSCEAGLFRLSYPELFADTYEVTEYETDAPGEEGEATVSKETMISFIQENISFAAEFTEKYNVELNHLKLEELTEVYNNTKRSVDASNA